MSDFSASLALHWMAIAFAEAGEVETARGLLAPASASVAVPRKPTEAQAASARRGAERLKAAGAPR
ncbi:MAG: hypothetical protein HQL99_04815 [Magnetococcales bacterium]|nr:hypothetical protein [Magnetococcales bacterium]